MSQRNLTELFSMLRNNVVYNKHLYTDTNNSDHVALLDRGSDGTDCPEQPAWISVYDDVVYLLTKIQTKIDDLEQIQGASARLVLNENNGDASRIQQQSEDVSRMISTAHSKIKSLKSHTRSKNRLEGVLQQNVEKKLMVALKCTTERLQKSQTTFIDKQNSMEQSSKQIFGDMPTFNSVDTFDNFLNMNVSTPSKGGIPDDNEAETLDEYFQLPASGLSLNQKQLMLIEADNTKMIRTREHEVSKIVDSIDSLNVVFKDLAQLVQEQGTILDRIDYNVECTQTKVFEGYKQLKIADTYQRKNKRIYCICILAGMIMFMIVLTIFTKL